MNQRTLFILHVTLATVLLSVHYYAFQHDLYWHYLWLDIPMHFIGGLWAGLATFWFLRLMSFPTTLTNVVLGILAIGIGWEIMEYVVGFQREANYAFDTGLDLVMDLSGGLCGFFALWYMVQSRNNVTTENNPS